MEERKQLTGVTVNDGVIDYSHASNLAYTTALGRVQSRADYGNNTDCGIIVKCNMNTKDTYLERCGKIDCPICGHILVQKALFSFADSMEVNPDAKAYMITLKLEKSKGFNGIYKNFCCEYSKVLQNAVKNEYFGNMVSFRSANSKVFIFDILLLNSSNNNNIDKFTEELLYWQLQYSFVMFKVQLIQGTEIYRHSINYAMNIILNRTRNKSIHPRFISIERYERQNKAADVSFTRTKLDNLIPKDIFAYVYDNPAFTESKSRNIIFSNDYRNKKLYPLTIADYAAMKAGANLAYDNSVETDETDADAADIDSTKFYTSDIDSEYEDMLPF